MQLLLLVSISSLVPINTLRNVYGCRKRYKTNDDIYMRYVRQAIYGQLGYIKDFIPWLIKTSSVTK